MVRAVVLVKQVPDLRAAPVGMTAEGTIAREQADAIINPADLHALEAALTIADEVLAVTMGPPRAAAVVRDAISRGAHAGVLLCDRAFAGSDTWATANALAAAIVRLGGADLVCCGLTALDGETGQVGPEVAERLGLPQATGCEELVVDGDRLIARRIVEGGYERVSVSLPALVTVAETGFVPRYPTMPGRRRAERAEVTTFTAADLGIDHDQVGLDASPTKVAHMAPAALADSGCRMVEGAFDLDALVAELAALGVGEAVPTTPPAASSTAVTGPSPSPSPDPTPAPARDPAAGDPAVWVVGEVDGGGLARVSAELLAAAVSLAPALGGGVGAVVAAADTGPAAAEAAGHGADVVFRAEDPELSPYRCLPHARVLADAIATRGPTAVLFGATTTGRELAPRVAGRLGLGLAADCTDLTVGPFDRRGVHHDALLHQIRPAMGGGVLATCVSPDARPQMATVRPGVFPLGADPVRARVVELPCAFTDADLDPVVVDRVVGASDVHLADADVVVAGGAGCDASSWHLVEELAAAIGGAVAATRGAVEAGLAPRSLQVGQTGQTVQPRLYVACGVSGALQHVVGMRRARTIVAVNRDPDAFVFRVAHFGIVGDVADVLPALTAAFRRAGAAAPSG